MGSGDWNDGMDLVGREGKGESVWLGFFLYDTLRRFEPLARARDDAEFADQCHKEADALARNIEAHSWDGDWYRRAYFDDGTPLGSTVNTECRIDSLAQSWAVITGLGDPERAEKGMRALDEQLIDRENMVIKLFKPPFDKSEPNPGYIKGYVPGVRENGGQYTHAAIWAAIAYAEMRDGEKTWEMQTLLNPLNHALTAATADKYKVEPYVVAADVYASRQHEGRGGWSWYTGSASWLYRFMIENILGFNFSVDTIRIYPCVPSAWDGFNVRYRRHGAVYDINVTRARAASEVGTVNIDGVNEDVNSIVIEHDDKEHRVEVVIR